LIFGIKINKLQRFKERWVKKARRKMKRNLLKEKKVILKRRKQ